MKTKEERRNELAIMLACRSFLYYSEMLSEQEAEKVFARIRKYQDKHKIALSEEQVCSVDFTYKD